MFVAGFIGSPAMSFATVRATRNGDALTLSRGELSLTLPSARLPDGVPAEVVVGIRPEHCHLWRDGRGLVGPIAGRTQFVEMLGRETLIGVETAAGSAVHRPRRARRGDETRRRGPLRRRARPPASVRHRDGAGARGRVGGSSLFPYG